MPIRGGNYDHEDPSRALLASEKALNMFVCGFLNSFLTPNVNCLASSAPVCSGLCGEQEVIPMVISCFKALVSDLPHCLTLISRLFSLRSNTLMC